MRMTSWLGLGFVAALALSSIGCSGSGEGVRTVAGSLKAGEGVTEVVALPASSEQKGTVYSAKVDASGAFRLDLPKDQRYVIVFKSGDQSTGVLRFKDGTTGAYTTLLPVAGEPSSMPSSKPLSEDDAEDDDDAEESEIGLGEVDDPAADGQYEPANNPLEQVDSDDDGDNDFEDADDDNDDVADDVDSDDDGDGVDDSSEDLDADDDGTPDEIDG